MKAVCAAFSVFCLSLSLTASAFAAGQGPGGANGTPPGASRSANAGNGGSGAAAGRPSAGAPQSGPVQNGPSSSGPGQSGSVHGNGNAPGGTSNPGSQAGPAHGNGSGSASNAPGQQGPASGSSSGPGSTTVGQPGSAPGNTSRPGSTANGGQPGSVHGNGQGARSSGPVQTGPAAGNNAACIGKKGMTCPPGPAGAATTSPVNGAACNTATQQCLNPASGACISNHGQYVSSLHKHGHGPQGNKTCGPAASGSSPVSSGASTSGSRGTTSTHHTLHLRRHGGRSGAVRGQTAASAPVAHTSRHHVHHRIKVHVREAGGAVGSTAGLHRSATTARTVRVTVTHGRRSQRAANCNPKSHRIRHGHHHATERVGASTSSNSSVSTLGSGTTAGMTRTGGNAACIGKKGMICPPGPSSANYASPLGNGAICNSVSQQCTNPASAACISNHGQYISSLHKHGSGPPNMHRTCTKGSSQAVSAECGVAQVPSSGGTSSGTTGGVHSGSGQSTVSTGERHGSSSSGKSSSVTGGLSVHRAVHSNRTLGMTRQSTGAVAAVSGRSTHLASTHVSSVHRARAAHAGHMRRGTVHTRSGIAAGTVSSHPRRERTQRRAIQSAASMPRVSGSPAHAAAGRALGIVTSRSSAVPSSTGRTRPTSSGGVLGSFSSIPSILPRTGGAIGATLSRLPLPVLPVMLTLLLIGCGMFLRRYSATMR